MGGRLLSLALVCSSATAFADPKFEYSKPEEVKDPSGVEWHATAEAGIVLTTGNSETTTATGGIKTSRKTGKNKFQFEASFAYAKSGVRVATDRNGSGDIDSDSEIETVSAVSAETINSKLRYDRFLDASGSLFLAALFSRDLPAGTESVIGTQLGYSRQLHKSKTAETVAELGFDLSREDLVTGDPLSIYSGRAFIGHKATMTEGADVDAAAELLTNFNEETLPTMKDGSALKDTRVNLKLAVSAKIGKNLAVQMSIEAKFDNRPAPLAIKNLAMGFVPEASKWDSIMKAQLIYTFAGK